MVARGALSYYPSPLSLLFYYPSPPSPDAAAASSSFPAPAEEGGCGCSCFPPDSATAMKDIARVSRKSSSSLVY